MNKLNRVAISMTLAAGTLAAGAAWAQSQEKEAKFVSAMTSEIKWADAPSVGPGAKIAVIEGDLKAAAPITFRLKVPPKTKLGVHTHPTYERVTVIAGTFYFATGDRFERTKARAYKAGDFFVVPPGMPMYAYTGKGESTLQIHGTGPWGISFLDKADGTKK